MGFTVAVDRSGRAARIASSCFAVVDKPLGNVHNNNHGIDELLKDKRAEILRIAEKHGAFNVRVFGSVARGEAGLNSDVDILVEVRQQHSSFFPGGLVADLEALLGRRVDIVTVNGLNKFLRERVLREAVAL